MIRVRTTRRLAAGVALALAVSACSGDGDDPQQAESPTASEQAGDEDPTEPTDDGASSPEAAGTLVLGHVIPETGQVAFLAPPMIAGFDMAVAEVNDAGGVLGTPVEVLRGDEAGDAAVASETADRLLGDGVAAIVGATASGMSLAIIDAVTGAEVVMCSPSNTAPSFTDYDDGGYYFRTAITDALQGPVLAEAILNDGHGRVALVGKGDDYGRGLSQAMQAALEEAGAEVPEAIVYDPDATNFASEVQQLRAADPDAIGIVATAEGAQLIQGLLEAGFTPDQLYSAEGLKSPDLPELVDPDDPNVLNGMKGSAPASSVNQEFVDRLNEFEPSLESTLFADSTYDCVVAVALAAQAAGSVDPTVFVEELNAVTRDGTPCTSFEECASALENGEDIDFNGASGPLDFVEQGEPSCGLFEIWTFDGGELSTVRDDLELCLE